VCFFVGIGSKLVYHKTDCTLDGGSTPVAQVSKIGDLMTFFLQRGSLLRNPRLDIFELTIA